MTQAVIVNKNPLLYMAHNVINLLNLSDVHVQHL